MPNYLIRKARPSDIDVIVELCKEHAEFEGADYDKKGKANLLSEYLFTDQSFVTCIVIEVDKQIKGYATYVPEFSTWDATYYLHMDCLYLRPDIRRKGLGKKIMKQIRQEAKEKGYTQLQWQTPIDNTNAITFYRKIGAVPKKKVRFYLEP